MDRSRRDMQALTVIRLGDVSDRSQAGFGLDLPNGIREG